MKRARSSSRPKSRQMTVFLPEAVAVRLETRAGLERRTRSQLAALLIEDALSGEAATAPAPAQKVG